jgi:hypothetical protein
VPLPVRKWVRCKMPHMRQSGMWGQRLVEPSTSAFTAWHLFHRTTCYAQSDNHRVTAVTSHGSQARLPGGFGSQSGSSMLNHEVVLFYFPNESCTEMLEPSFALSFRDEYALSITAPVIHLRQPTDIVAANKQLT